MKPATITEIKKELKQLDQEELEQLCLRLAKFKKDNKELLTYLLFDSKDEQDYIKSVKHEIDDAMEEINTSHIYYAKKGLQKINRNINKNIRYSAKKQTEVEILIHFAKAINKSRIAIHRSSVLSNLYSRIVAKIKKAALGLHEDLQADYSKDIERL